MFSKISRYRKLPDVTSIDAKGRLLKSKAARLLPQASGDFFHTVAEVDRLDHLAKKYYDQPRKWWRICDANPEFLAPQAVLGHEPIGIVRVPVTWNDQENEPPWNQTRDELLRGELSQDEPLLLVGVLDVEILEQVAPLPEERAFVVTYNKINLSVESIVNRIASHGFEPGKPHHLGRTGKRIVIPTDTIG